MVVVIAQKSPVSTSQREAGLFFDKLRSRGFADLDHRSKPLSLFEFPCVARTTAYDRDRVRVYGEFFRAGLVDGKIRTTSELTTSRETAGLVFIGIENRAYPGRYEINGYVIAAWVKEYAARFLVQGADHRLDHITTLSNIHAVDPVSGLETTKTALLYQAQLTTYAPPDIDEGIRRTIVAARVLGRLNRSSIYRRAGEALVELDQIKAIKETIADSKRQREFNKAMKEIETELGETFAPPGKPPLSQRLKNEAELETGFLAFLAKHE
ncbi:hypothetical protein HY990_06770 [Candidatus Micrarchaeota archaeon]|nr:hypothetical protein [Candidatus Micrarchaeota archaeon]